MGYRLRNAQHTPQKLCTRKGLSFTAVPTEQGVTVTPTRPWASPASKQGHDQGAYHRCIFYLVCLPFSIQRQGHAWRRTEASSAQTKSGSITTPTHTASKQGHDQGAHHRCIFYLICLPFSIQRQGHAWRRTEASSAQTKSGSITTPTHSTPRVAA